jgi:hypothetical protein
MIWCYSVALEILQAAFRRCGYADMNFEIFQEKLASVTVANSTAMLLLVAYVVAIATTVIID